MKGLILVFLVAVCQGAILRDRFPTRHQVSRFEQHVRKEMSKGIKRAEEFPVESIKVPQLKEPVRENDFVQQLEKRYPSKSILLKEPSKLVKSVELEQLKPKLPYERKVILDNYSKPRTFLNFVRTFQEKPWNFVRTFQEKPWNFIRTFQEKPWNQLGMLNTDVFDYKNFKDLIQFPGGDILQREINKCMWNMRDTSLPFDKQLPEYFQKEYQETIPLDMDLNMDLENVKEIRDVIPFIVQRLENMVPVYRETIEDPSTVALLVTRDLIKIVLHGRMKCPTTTWDKYLIENVQGQLFTTMQENKLKLQDNFRTLLPEVLPLDRELLEELVETFTKKIQDEVYQDVMEYANGLGFKDVAIVCHKLYRELKRVFEESWRQDVPDFMEKVVTVVTEVIINYGSCPKPESFQKKMYFACWDFNKWFLEREVSRVHSRVMNIVHNLLYRTCESEDCTQYYPRMTDMFKNAIERYVSTVVQGVPMCRTPECLDPTQCFYNHRITETPKHRL